MKRIIKAQKHLAILLAVAMLSQSCVVYQNTTVTLKDAIATKDMRYKKIKTYEGKKYKLRRIADVDGQLYGSKEEYGKLIPLGITPNDVASVWPQDKVSSTAVTILAGLGITFTILFLICIKNPLSDQCVL